VIPKSFLQQAQVFAGDLFFLRVEPRRFELVMRDGMEHAGQVQVVPARNAPFAGYLPEYQRHLGGKESRSFVLFTPRSFADAPFPPASAA
jgi:hypothetical protein